MTDTTFITDWTVALLRFLLFLPLGLIVLVIFTLLGRLISALTWRFLDWRARRRGDIYRRERTRTLRGLIRSLGDALAVIATVIFMLAQVMPATAIATTIGLFSAGLGLAARPFISDVMSGLLFLMRDQFAIGDKVEMGDRNVVGYVQSVDLTSTRLRGEAGELYILPNGDIRTIRNFSRSKFSPANIKVVVPTEQLTATLDALHEVIGIRDPDFMEEPQVISEGQLGPTTALTLKVNATYGTAPEVRQRVMTRLVEALARRGVMGSAEAAEERPAETAPPYQASGSPATRPIEKEL
ncbi:MAG: mechanosensitive ion channel family protein [Anaerolineae bacterium]|nr:mechanosensitive ion channel family protein [Anaerolineae bacterium]